MPDFLDNDHTTMHSTYYAAAASPPLPTTDMPQAAGSKDKEPLTPHPNAPTDTDMTSAKTRQVTKATKAGKERTPVNDAGECGTVRRPASVITG